MTEPVAGAPPEPPADGQPAAGAAERPTIRALLFGAPWARLALALDQIEELLPTPAIARLPFVPVWLRGAVSLRGEAIPVVDLAPLLGEEPTVADESSRLVIVHERAGGVRLGLLTEALEGVREIEDRASAEPERTITGHPFLRHAARPAGEAVARIDTAALVATLRARLAESAGRLTARPESSKE